MKKYIHLFVLALLLPTLAAFSQKYKNLDDTIKLNKEYVKVTEDLAKLNEKLADAEGDLEKFQSKARKADESAADAASESSEKAAKAENGNVKDAKAAKRKADKAYDEAKDFRSAKNRVGDQERKIARYRSDIIDKQNRIQELEAMRAKILEKMPLVN